MTRVRDLRRSRLAALCAGLALAAAATLAAGDEGVYGPMAPPHSAFIRVFNAGGHELAGARIADKSFSEIEPQAASEFEFLPPGTYPLAVGGTSQPVTLQADRYYTAVAGDGRMRLLDNERYGNRLKALVILYNLTEAEGLSLRTADGKTAVVEGVAPDAFGTREVNAVKVSFALFDGSKRVAEVTPMHLERGKAFSLFVLGSKEQPVPVWVVN